MEEVLKGNDYLKKLICDDFDYLYDKLNLSWDDKTKEAMLPQSVQGRLIEGHGPYFKEYVEISGKKPPFVSYTEILSVLNMDIKENFDYRTQLAGEIREWFLNLVTQSSGIIRFTAPYGKYLARNKGLKELNFPIERKDVVLKGLIAAFMDSDYWRRRTVSKYGVTFNGEKLNMGYGKEEPINLDVLNSFDQTSKILESEEHDEQQIRVLREKGLIKKLNSDDWVLTDGTVNNMYIRGKVGSGGCDDATLTSIGLVHGPEAFIAGIQIDFLDTVGKYCNWIANGGIDESLGITISKLLKEGFISPDEIMQAIYLGAKNNFPYIGFSSSARRFVEIVGKSSKPTFLEHYEWIKDGTRPASHKLGFEGMVNEFFYDKMAQRFVSYGLKEYVLNHSKKKNTKKPFTKSISKRSLPKKSKNIFSHLDEILSDRDISENEINSVYVNVPLFNLGKRASRIDLDSLCGKAGLVEDRNVQVCKIPSNRRVNRKLHDKDYKNLKQKFHSSLDLVLFSDKGAIIIKTKDKNKKFHRGSLKQKFEQTYGQNVMSVIYL